MSENGALTMPGALDRAARDHPHVEALVDGPVRLTYSQLRDQVQAATRAFVALGVDRGDRIAVWAPNSRHWIVTALGAVGAGAVLVPINTRYKADEARWLLARSDARMLFVEDGFLGNGYLAMLGVRDGSGPPVPELPGLVEVVTYDGEERPGATGWDAFLGKGAQGSDERAVARSAAVTTEDLADVLFTSGTTGRPKGVMCTHGQNVRTYESWCERVGLIPGDRYLIVNPMFHCFGYKAGVLACLLRGATMVLQPVFEADETMRLIEAERITVLPGPPTIYTTMLDAPGRSRFDLSSLRLVVTGSAVVPIALVRRIRTELLAHVVTAYGLTESCGTVTACSVGDDDTTIANTSGRPIDGVEVAVVDAQGAPVRTGQDGEILVRGYNVMRGYLDDEKATAATIHDGWLLTGDLGRLDDRGNLTITGRSKDVFMVGGFNVYPAEVEQLLARHDGVAEAAVIGVPDERLGEVGRAYVTARPGAGLDAETLIAYCRDRLANFKVPRQVVIVEDLPRNASGKVQKAELAAITLTKEKQS